MNKARRNRLVFIAIIGLFIVLGCKSCVTPQMDFDKSAQPSIFTGPGEVITYTYTLKNTNSVVLTFSITDDKLGAVPCQVSELGAGATATCQLTYTTTEEDVAIGVIQNTASAIGAVGPQGPFTFDETVMTASAEVVYQPPKCQLEITKSANPTTYITAGEVIEYTYDIHNIGYGDVSGPFTVVDDRVDESSCDDAGGTFSLCVDCSMSCRGSYTIKDSDVGSNITNVAHVEGVCDANNARVSSNTATATVNYLMPTPTSQSLPPQLTVTETLNQTVYSRAGEVIVYTYKVRNTGQTNVQGPFKVVDSLLDQWECDAENILPVGGELTCKGYYAVKASVVGSDITNSSHVEGLYPGGMVASNTVSDIVYYISTNKKKPVTEPEPEAEPDQPAKPPIIICDGPCPWQE